MSKWETGEATPELGKLPLLAKAFGVSADYLLSDEEPEEPKAPESPKAAAPASRASYPDWVDHLPGFLSNLIRRFGWIFGVRIAISGAAFIAIGAVAKAITGQMMNSFNSISGSMGFGGGFNAMFPGSSGIVATASSPMNTMAGFIIGIGLVMLIGGVLLALALYRYGRKQ